MKKKERKNLKKLYKSNKFCDILQINKGITAFIGSGGKTSLIGKLCSELADLGRVIFTTTTHVMRPTDLPVATNLSELEQLISTETTTVSVNKPDRVYCIGSTMPDTPRKLSSPNVSMDVLAGKADYLLVEADGSKMLPLKAHKSYEPVIPGNSSAVILVVGMSGFGCRVGDAVHRTEEFKALTGAEPDDIVTPEMIAKAVAAELPNYGGFDVRIYLNQADVEEGGAKAEKFAKALRTFTCNEQSGKAKIFAGSLKEGYIYEL